MKKIHRRVISETQIAVVVDSVARASIRCERCGEASVMVSPLLAAKATRMSTREIYRLIEASKIHFVETADRQMFICHAALMAIRSAKQANLELCPTRSMTVGKNLLEVNNEKDKITRTAVCIDGFGGCDKTGTRRRA